MARADLALGWIFDWRKWLWAFVPSGGGMTLLWAAIEGRSPLDVWIAAIVVMAALAVTVYFLLAILEKVKISRTRHGVRPANGEVGAPPLSSDAALEIIFDPANPSQRFWSRESPRDENGNKKPGLFWEYRIAIKNNSQKTIRNVSVTVEHIGQNLPVRPVDAIFDKIRKNSCDLKPGADELVAILRWPIPIIQAGMLANQTALEYGPVKVTASGDDVPPSVRVFQFDYQSEPMLFDSFETSVKSLRDAAAELYGEIVLTKLGKLTKDQCASEEEIWDAMGTMMINRSRVYGRRPGSPKIEEIPKRQLWYSRLVGGAKLIRENATAKKTEFTDLQITRTDLNAMIEDAKSRANDPLLQ